MNSTKSPEFEEPIRAQRAKNHYLPFLLPHRAATYFFLKAFENSICREGFFAVR